VCGECLSQPSRRQVLFAAATGILTVGAGAPVSHGRAGRSIVPVEVGPGLRIWPRDGWGRDLQPVGPTQPEPNVKFLLVHHTAGSNKYEKQDVVSKIREVYSFHTSSSKKWVDVCYNFFVDRFGGVWEGRAGSLAGPVRADATGGSQGFAQLVCLLGNFETEKPTTAMMDSCSRVLGWLADKYAVDLDQRRQVAFVSRGSNRWPQGAKVNARPISGHRDMSATACPGRHVYGLLEEVVPRAAKAAKDEFARNRRSGSSPSTISPRTVRRP
jgi:hypothetical protein